MARTPSSTGAHVRLAALLLVAVGCGGSRTETSLAALPPGLQNWPAGAMGEIIEHLQIDDPREIAKAASSLTPVDLERAGITRHGRR
jgi:hypothetical protein